MTTVASVYYKRGDISKTREVAANYVWHLNETSGRPEAGERMSEQQWKKANTVQAPVWNVGALTSVEKKDIESWVSE